MTLRPGNRPTRPCDPTLPGTDRQGHDIPNERMRTSTCDKARGPTVPQQTVEPKIRASQPEGAESNTRKMHTID